MVVQCFKLQGTPSNSEWGQPVIYKSNLYRVSELTIIILFESLTVWLNHTIHVECHAAKFPSSYEIESQFTESSSRLHLPTWKQSVFNMKWAIIFKKINQKRSLHFWGMRNVLTSETYIFKIYVDIYTNSSISGSQMLRFVKGRKRHWNQIKSLTSLKAKQAYNKHIQLSIT